MKAEVRTFLRKLSPQVRGRVMALRELVLRVAPSAEETVLWGTLSYHRPAVGGRVKGTVCMIVVKGNSVRLDFIHGVRLSDPAHILRDDLASKRFVLIESVADVARDEIAHLIGEAAALDPETWDDPHGIGRRSI